MSQRLLDTAQLRTFIAVADAGSVSAAAERVFLSQSSVSEQLRKLEERIGQSLFVRSKQGVSATPAGVRLLDHARRIVAMSEAAFDDLQGRALDGELRIAITDYYRPHDIARILKSFSAQHPRLKLHVTVMPSAVIDAGANDGASFDIGLTLRLMTTGARAGALTRAARPRSTAVRREKLVWTMSSDFEPPSEGPLPVVMLPGTCQLQRYVAKLLERHKLPYVISHSASGVAGLQLALQAGLGISCLNESALGAGLVACSASRGLRSALPELPMVEFHLLPGHAHESELVRNARTALTRLFN